MHSPKTASIQAVDSLIAAQLLAHEQRDQALSVVHDAFLPQQNPEAQARKTSPLSEVASWVGGAFLLAAAAFLFATSWDSFSYFAQVMLFVAGAATAGGAAFAVTKNTELTERARTDSDLGAAGRLYSFLVFAAGACTTGAVLVSEMFGAEGPAWLIAPLIGVAICAAGYKAIATSGGQWAMAVGLVASAIGASWTASDASTADDWGLSAGAAAWVVYAAIVAAGWLLGAEKGLWKDTGTAAAIGTLTAFAAAAGVGFATESISGAWAAMLALAAAFIVRYTVGSQTQEHSVIRTSYLAVGILSLIVAIPMAAGDLFGDSLGVAGLLFLTGATLVAGGTAGFWLKKNR